MTNPESRHEPGSMQGSIAWLASMAERYRERVELSLSTMGEPGAEIAREIATEIAQDGLTFAKNVTDWE